ncbi:MAG: radical SAM protein, partial [Proteobacteria bacterium]|nr:radical SAM protein [Pseudomonadota bacterium]
MDKYKIDSHKLIYHVERTNEWLSGEDIYPIYVEMSP